MSNDIIDVNPKMPEIVMPQMPQIMSMFPNMIPVHIPQRSWNTGLLAGWHRGRKLKQIANEAAYDAAIAGSKLQMVEDNAAMVVCVVSLAGRIDAAIEQNRAAVELAKASVLEAQLKNQILFNEARSIELDNLMKEHEWKEMTNGHSKEEARND
ncbi:MAG: hypothetical protein ABSG35_10750 [Syntrophobacteraceae bacterium]|jgi:hypothetical protein